MASALRQELGAGRRAVAASLQQKHRLSDEQATYERTQYCPQEGRFTIVGFYRTVLTMEQRVGPIISSWLLKSDPYDEGASTDDRTHLIPGDYARCENGHTWWVYATGGALKGP